MILQDIPVVQTPTTIIVAIVGAVAGFVGPLTMAWFLNRNARRMKAEDYARQDLVADRLEKRQNEAAASAKDQGAKLTQIHDLVNHNLAEAKQAALDALRKLIVIERKREHLTEQEQAEIATNEVKAEELQSWLTTTAALTEQAAARLKLDLAIAPPVE